MTRQAAIERARAGREQAQAEYFDELRIPSVSALSEHAADCRRCAEMLREKLAQAGMDARLVEGDGHPTVYAEWLGAPGKPTLLVYGHYDVQPPDPLDEWHSPPFEPTVRDGMVYARGAADSKGNHFGLVKAVEHVMAANGGRLPVNLRITIEGEEEGGGSVLPEFLKREKDNLKSDCVALLDGGFELPGVPAIATATRGIVYTEVEIAGARQDLHSGSYGGIAPNPVQTAAWIAAGLKAPDGKILIPGFYDQVKQPSYEELASWDQTAIDEKQMLKEMGSPELAGELDQPLLLRRWSRPTLEVHGIRGGFTGEGTKTVIPARAVMKVSMRLVPDQDPQRVFELFEEHVLSLATPGTRVTVRPIGPPSAAVAFGTDHLGVTTLVSAYKKVWPADPIFIRTGGSIPVGEDFARELKAPMTNLGFAPPEEGAHSPNEHMDLEMFHQGTETLIHWLYDLADAS